MKHPKFATFVLTPQAFDLRRKGGWGLHWKESQIGTFLDAVEAAQREGVEVHQLCDYPAINNQYLAWLYKEGYLKPFPLYQIHT